MRSALGHHEKPPHDGLTQKSAARKGDAKMAQGYPKNFKNCAVCNYWDGSRQVDTFGQRVTVDSSSAKGKCLLQGGPWKGQDKQASATCNKWQAWGALK